MKLSLIALATTMFLAGCSGAEDGADDGVDEAELKKRIGSEASTVGLHFEEGAYGAGAFLNWITVSGSDRKLLPGDTVELPPGRYWPRLGGEYAMFHDGPNSAYALGDFTVSGGAVANVPAVQCLAVRAATPITFAASSPELFVHRREDGNYSFARIPLAKHNDALNGASGVRMLIPTWEARLDYANTWKDVTLKKGKCVTAKLPTVAIEAQFDDVDPAFPDPFYGGNEAQVIVNGAKMPIRSFGTQTALAGLEVQVAVWGVTKTVAKPSYIPKQGTLSVRAHRLEVEHLVETTQGGVKRAVPGWYDVYHVTPLGKERIIAVARTQTGVDLVDGDYEVRVTAQGSVGPLGQTHRVSFP